MDFTREREAMVERQLKRRGISDQRIIDAFLAVPREQFLGPIYRLQAYGDHPLPIAAGQTISQPFVVALMIQAAAIAADDRVLEVGAGSGYAAAIFGRLAKSVIAIERVPELAAEARERLARLGSDNVAVVAGDGTSGWPEEAPFDAILVAASAPAVPQPLIDQLAPGGRLVMPIGDPRLAQELTVLTKSGDGQCRQDKLGGVRFVPLIAATSSYPLQPRR